MKRLTMLRLVSFFYLLLIVFTAQSEEIKGSKKSQKRCLSVHNEWMGLIIELTKNTPGYTAPVAARTFNYISLGMYESSITVLPNNRSLKGQLQNFSMTINANQSSFDPVLYCNQVDYLLVIYFFENMPPSYSQKVEELHTTLIKSHSKCFNLIQRESERMARSLVEDILNLSNKDGAGEAWNSNFPPEYLPPVCDSCWVKTSPGYLSALQPYWGYNSLMYSDNSTICTDIPFLPFSTDSTSKFYHEAKMIHDSYLLIDHAKIDIAKYWDDSPGVSGTPVGHLYSIAMDNLSTNKAGLQKSIELYVLLGVALNDAVIESWKLKYRFNLIRPITYIQKHISPRFSTAIATPPFPEFPSGHSFQAGAGSEVLNFILGKESSFTDETNVNRVDINGRARTFRNFDAMAEEMSLSRFYGGIHYMNTLDVSLEYGRKIGMNTVMNIKLRLE